MDREAGGITQHIGATEVPSDILNDLCAPLLGGKTFDSPGLLFIDTPGHHSFSTLRSRGGSLADIAILIVDVMEGARPQTLESLRVLKNARTPFVIAANKVDRVHGWDAQEGRAMALSMRNQSKDTIALFETRYWELVGKFAEEGLNIERYDRVKDFTKDIALVPISAREGEGIQDLLAVVIGLAERYLTEQLTDVEGSGEGTVLEMKEERGLGKTLDVILHRGSIRKGDEIVVATSEGGISTRVKGLFSPRGMSEMRDAGDRWDDTDIAHARVGPQDIGPGFGQRPRRNHTTRGEQRGGARGGNLSRNIRVRAVDRAGRGGGLHKGRHSRRPRGPGEGASGGRRPHQERFDRKGQQEGRQER